MISSAIAVYPVSMEAMMTLVVAIMAHIHSHERRVWILLKISPRFRSVSFYAAMDASAMRSFDFTSSCRTTI